MNHLRLLDAVVHVVEGAGPGRLDVKPEMVQGHAGHGEGNCGAGGHTLVT